MSAITVRPGEVVTVIGLWSLDPNAPHPEHPIMLPGMPGWGVPPGARPSHPIALPGDPWWPAPPVDPNAPRPTHPISLPGDPWWGTSPPTEPPPVQPPSMDSGDMVWAWSPQLNRWVWVKVPGEGEAGPKTA
jgi:hypothetical protein